MQGILTFMLPLWPAEIGFRPSGVHAIVERLIEVGRHSPGRLKMLEPTQAIKAGYC